MMHDIFIPISEINGAKNGIKAVAEITDWPAGSQKPDWPYQACIG
jgi:ribonuclease R